MDNIPFEKKMSDLIVFYRGNTDAIPAPETKETDSCTKVKKEQKNKDCKEYKRLMNRKKY